MSLNLLGILINYLKRELINQMNKRDRDEDRDLGSLINWVKENKSDLQGKITSVGGILFRGFNVKRAQDFEDIAKEITIEPLKVPYYQLLKVK